MLNHTIIHSDCVEAMEKMDDASIQLVVTSPPYDNLRDYGGHTWDFEATARQLTRVICDGGIICWNVNDSVIDGSETLTSCKQKIFFNEECGLRIHDTMIYGKTNFNHPEKTRYYQCFEYVFVMTKGDPRVFNPIRDKPNKWAGKTAFGKNTVRGRDGSLTETPKKVYEEFGVRGNIWIGKTAGQEGQLCAKNRDSTHPAPMPRWLAHDLILSWSNAGDTVLDPFGGRGTTAREANELGRHAISIEIHEPYIALIRRDTDNITPGLLIDA